MENRRVRVGIQWTQAVNVIVPLITVTADEVPHLSTQRILHSDNEVEETYK